MPTSSRGPGARVARGRTAANDNAYGTPVQRMSSQAQDHFFVVIKRPRPVRSGRPRGRRRLHEARIGTRTTKGSPGWAAEQVRAAPIPDNKMALLSGPVPFRSRKTRPREATPGRKWDRTSLGYASISDTSTLGTDFGRALRRDIVRWNVLDPAVKGDDRSVRPLASRPPRRKRPHSSAPRSDLRSVAPFPGVSRVLLAWMRPCRAGHGRRETERIGSWEEEQGSPRPPRGMLILHRADGWRPVRPATATPPARAGQRSSRRRCAGSPSRGRSSPPAACAGG